MAPAGRTVTVRPVAAGVSVYVLHWNAPDFALAAVQSLLTSADIDIQVTVIDNASEPTALDALRAGLPSTVTLTELDRNTGYSGAANAGIADFLARDGSPDDVFFVAAHDVLVEPTTVGQIQAGMSANPRYGILGPSQWAPDFSTLRSIGGTFRGTKGAPVQRAVHTPYDRDTPGIVDVAWISGSLMGIRRQCIVDTGPFDTDLFAYYEDVEICLRAADHGWQVGVVMPARAAQSGYSASYDTLAYFIARNRLLVSAKRLGRTAVGVTAARIAVEMGQAFIGSLDVRRPRDRRSMSRAFARGRWRGLRDGLARRGGPPPGAGSATRPRPASA